MRSSARSQQPGYNRDQEFFRTQAAMYFTWVRGDRYPMHDIEYLRDFLAPHSEILQEEYGLSAARIADEIQRIQNSHTHGISEMCKGLHGSRERFIAFAEREDPDGQMSSSEIMDRFMEQEGEKETSQKLSGQFLGTDLIDLAKISDLTVEFLDALSFSPGEDDRFFAPGEKAGWPLRVLPIDRRPFLKYEGRYYYFNTHILFDRLYRAVEQSVRARRPDYGLTWKQRQNEVSEARPRDILAASLPDATSYGSMQYQAPTGKDGKLNWCEVDGVILSHETVFILEIKAGAFTWTSPDDDWEAHLRSMDALFAKPARQAHRLISRLRDKGTVDLCDGDRQPVLRLDLAEHPHVIPISITLDCLGAWAHQVKELRQVGLDVPPAICCSIDDLRIYRDAFTSPALLLAYLHLRHEAEQIADMHVNDELEHFGLFLAHGDYINEARKQTNELGAPVRAWAGFAEQIDRHFQTKFRGEDVAELSWPYCPVLVRTAEAILRSGRQGRTEHMLFLLRSPKRTRSRLASKTARALATAGAGGKQVCFDTTVTIGGLPVIGVAHAKGASPSQVAAVQAACKLLHKQEADEGWVLAVAPSGGIPLIEWYRGSPGNLPKSEAIAIEAAAVSEVKTIREWRRLPKMRNRPCPCGSGRKFKKCCGR